MDGSSELPRTLSQLFMLFAEELLNRDCHKSAAKIKNQPPTTSTSVAYIKVSKQKIIVGYPN